MRTKEGLVLSVYSGAGFLLFPFLQYVTCCLQCSVLLCKAEPDEIGVVVLVGLAVESGEWDGSKALVLDHPLCKSVVVGLI